GVADAERRVEDAVEVRCHLGGVVVGAAEFDGAGDMSGDGVADGLEDGDGAVALGEPVPAAGAAVDSLSAAGEVDVDGREGEARRHGGTKARSGRRCRVWPRTWDERAAIMIGGKIKGRKLFAAGEAEVLALGRGGGVLGRG